MLNPQIAWLLIISAMVVAVIAQVRVSSAFKKFSRVRTRRGLTGAEVAEGILADAGIHDVEVVRTESFLGDHYDPTKKVLCLSPGVYDSDSVAAVGIAAHECGHAVQHAQAYAPLKARMAVVPATMFASNLLPLVIIGGLWFRIMGFITLGIVVYTILTVFQLITLPVEFDASRRAKMILTRTGVVTSDEAAGVNKVLNAAALTYVAAFLSSLFYLVYLLAVRDSRR
ncbi:MAG TPA: zinc metallopeptidase [Verrucomicrobiae bacterium]|nr:zinc metallopeptidase [Verrucomicrobiae bacterium]